MLVTCQKLSPLGCAGRVELERAVKPLLKLGQKTFTVKKGAKGYVSIKLTAQGAEAPAQEQDDAGEGDRAS